MLPRQIVDNLHACKRTISPTLDEKWIGEARYCLQRFALEPLIRLDLQQSQPNSNDLQHTLQSYFTRHELNTVGLLRCG